MTAREGSETGGQAPAGGDAVGLFAKLLMAVGGLLALLAGLTCGLILWVIGSETGAGSMVSAYVLVGLIGGVPILIGVTLFAAGGMLSLRAGRPTLLPLPDPGNLRP